MLRYAITNVTEADPGPAILSAGARRRRLLRQVAQWAAGGIDVIQLREKTLGAGEQGLLAVAAAAVLARVPPGVPRPLLLINGRADVAAAAGADGVHLTAGAGELRPEQVRAVFRAAGRPACVVSVSCHTLAEVRTARERGADLVLFSPVFEKRVAGQQVAQGTGLPALAEACRLAAPVRVLAMGGVQGDDIGRCLAAGAAGVAGIRLFAATSG